jgi:hypothetical protein
MQLVTILRDLWRLRLVVCLAAVLSVLVGLSAAFKLPSLETRRYEVGVATASVLVDTPKSQVVEVAPKGSEWTGLKANLIANLMVQGVVKQDIAERAGVPEEDLEGITESQSEPTASAAPTNPRGHVLTTRVIAGTDGDLPLIEIEAQAPDVAGATRLADAALDGLTDYLDSKAAKEQVSDASRLRVDATGEPQAGLEVRGPGPMLAFALTLFVFVAACAGILGLFALVRAWKTMTAEESDGPEYRYRITLVDDLPTDSDQDSADQDVDRPPAWAPPEPRRRSRRGRGPRGGA